MDPKISVLADIDMDGTYVSLVVTGRLTEANQQGLHPLIRQARSMAPGGVISVDLRGAEDVEDGAVESLRWAIGHNNDTGPATESVDIHIPDHAPDHEPRATPAPEAAV